MIILEIFAGILVLVIFSVLIGIINWMFIGLLNWILKQFGIEKEIDPAKLMIKWLSSRGPNVKMMRKQVKTEEVINK